MTTIRIGLDVGGTHTDAAAIDDHGTVLAWHKTATTAEVHLGIGQAVRGVLDGLDRSAVRQVMLGTTHALNALIRRRGLGRVGILRIGAPATLAISPLSGWPKELADAVRGPVAVVRGGHEYDGTEFMPLDEDAVRDFAYACRTGVDAIALTAVGAPVRPQHEEWAAQIVAEAVGQAVPITLGSEVAGTGIIERENTAVLNAALHSIGREIVEGLVRILSELDLTAEIYLTQNDGTLLGAEEAVRRPILTVGSGPTNSMRGAAYLSRLSDAIVMDVGGTSTDVGLLVDGFPRTSAHNVEIGGVRTNFRMPDLISIGLGGGSLVRTDPELTIGPDSVGYLLTERGLAFGGDTLTLTDVSVAEGRIKLGDHAVDELVPANVRKAAVAWVDKSMHVLTDRIKASRADIPLVAVGGGAHLVPDSIEGVSEVVRLEHAGVANAIGAAIAEASGTVDRNFVYSQSSREQCLEQAKEFAREAAIRAGADPKKLRITTVTEVPMTYMPGDCARVIVRAVGPLVIVTD
ncbi:hydantoinase/oxoprolinase family protein [Streptomyces sp. NPDC056296]|uniref:hydantoinase/oxoprolinase family protein n=1 Tax=Streptomyces sp. NPDC056296 TaxID=3345775 RepID=UPI0035D7AF7B